MRLPVVLGKYELVESLATGGMAELFLANARGPAGVRKTVVIKRIRPEHSEDPRFVGLFINEARIGIQLTHPNIVQVYDLGRAQGSWYIAMEYVHGRDLMRILRQLRALDERLPPAIAVHLIAELLRGLHHAHTRTTSDGRPLGLVHHDVSPHNVLVGFDGQVKLVDFGIARILHEGTPVSGDSGTPAGRGKLAYRSPESTASIADHRADLYGAGVVLWELLAGTRAYPDLPPDARAKALLAEGMPALEVEGLSPALAAIVHRATRADPSQRHSSAARFEEDLRAWLYQAGQRVRGDDVAAWMERLFPGEQAPISTFDVEEIGEDLERLETAASEHSRLRPALPGRLQQSPGERKQVAVLVVDVDGLTQLSAELEPEHFVARHFRLLRWVRRVVDHWGGVLQRAIDDHLVILFGVPRTREDDLSRALDCALDLVNRRGELAEKGLDMQFCIGLHAGEVTVAMTRRRVQYLARGNTTRLARRLSAAADHGEILVSERVLSQMEADFRLRQGPSVPSRGGEGTLPSYRLEARRTGVRIAQRGPWIRRGSEVDHLRAGLEQLAAGRGSALALVGPVGAGKSRMLREVQQLALRRGIPYQLVRCGRFGRVHAFAELIEALLGLDPKQDLADQLATSGHRGRVRAAFRWALGLPGPSPGEGEVRRALAQVVRGLCANGPVILALECEGLEPADLHDLTALIERTADLPLMYLLASRPPVSARLASVARVVELGRLDPEALERMLIGLLDVDSIAPPLLDLVVRTCEGNPLYVEEMVKYLLDREQLGLEARHAVLLTAPVGLPDTLHGLLSARIDALDGASKGVLQLASVIGESFSGALIGRAAGLEDPTPLLMELEACGLILRTADAWMFATELVRQAAGRGILGVQRRDYHRLVSEALEDLHAGHLHTVAEELAVHCARGGRWLDAARYAHQAGTNLERAGRLEDARTQYQAGLRFVARASDPELHDARVQGEAALNLSVGAVSLLLGDAVQGRSSLSLALDIAGDAGLPWIESRAHLRLGSSYLHAGNTRLAAAHLGQAVAMAGEEADVELEALEATATLALEEGRHQDAERVWQQVLDRAGGDAALTARCLTGLATQFMQTGEGARAEPMLEAALRAAQSSGDRILEGRVLNNIGMLHSIQGDYQTALRFYRQALEAREGIGYSRGIAINHHNVGDAHFHLEDWPRAHVAFVRSRELAEQTGWLRGCVLNDVFLTYLDARRDRTRVDSTMRARFVELERRAVELGDAQIAVTARWLEGRLCWECGDRAEAITLLQRALEMAEAHRLAPEAQRIRVSLAMDR